ncbi:helix-turn-helix domain-containing protein [Falsihalocynthiibacter sp. BN13B15]|uniref:arsenate reductase/protein-tyrosine-phosphatase family protein n=1 Tax=Falsihalocynthiibacter sp. BN13B15 TaxID=3240871 RepID=UPI003510BD05
MEFKLLDRLATLSHPQRMAIFRLLIRRYPDALPVAEILTVLDLKPSTASVYLSTLKSAGLVHQRRLGTSLLYSANIAASQEIVSGLFSNCCGGRADLCLPTDLSKPATQPSVLFLCTGNSARSIMAETILRDWQGRTFTVASAGTKPRAGVHAIARDVLLSKGHNIQNLHSKNITTVLGETTSDFDFVFTVCDNAANQDSGALHGTPIASHWGIEDPVPAANSLDKASRDRFENTYEMLNTRISRFATLPFETASRADLQKSVDDIARN